MADRPISLSNTLLMLLLITFWGTSFVVVKITLQEGLTPIAIATFRFLLASLMFLFTLALNKLHNPNYNLLINKNDLPTILFLALTGVTLFFTIQYTGIQLANASIASILVCLLSPILITILSARILKERLTTKQTLGIAIALTGTSTVIAESLTGLNVNSNFFIGTMILLLTPILWAAYTVTGKTIMKKYSPFLITAYATITGAICLTPFSISENSLATITTLSLQGWTAILYLSFACSLLGYFIWFYVANQVKAAVASSFMFAEPLITVLFASTFAGETITLLVAAGGFLIFIGVYLVSKK